MKILPVIVLLVAVAVAGCGSKDEAASPTATGPATTLESGSGPDISGTGLDGEALSVADFRGKPVFVNVWSSW
ncbi:MAG: hypothetical protein H0V94_00615 [Actinobacteria bacterium]|nr:hypothetical protein [Actinomycetota bacterium]